MSFDRPSPPNAAATSSSAPSPSTDVVTATPTLRTPIMLRLGVRPTSLGPVTGGQVAPPSTPRGVETDRKSVYDSHDDSRSGEHAPVESATPSRAGDGTRTPPTSMKLRTSTSTSIPSATISQHQHRGRVTRRATNVSESDPPPTTILPISIDGRNRTALSPINVTKTFMQGGRMSGLSTPTSSSSSKPVGMAKRSHKAGGGLVAATRDRPRSTQSFVTCLDYPPKESRDEYGGSLIGGPAVIGGVATKAQRKSKVEAIGRLDTSSSTPTVMDTPALASGPSKIGTSGLVPVPPSASASTSPAPQSTPLPGRPSNNPILKAQALPLAPALDLNTVRTTAPRHPPSRTQPRMFGLDECPTFYPTEEEFADPMEYVKKVGEQGGAKNWGICKIVPPEGWKMPFVLDSQTFRFRTRLQRLNSLEASSRAKINFLQQLQMFHSQQGNPNITIPIIDRQPLDVWALRKAVTKIGSAEKITREKRWGEVARAIGFTAVQAHQCKTAYSRIIQPFEDFQHRVKTHSPAFKRNGEDDARVSPTGDPAIKLPTLSLKLPGSKTTKVGGIVGSGDAEHSTKLNRRGSGSTIVTAGEDVDTAVQGGSRATSSDILTRGVSRARSTESAPLVSSVNPLPSPNQDTLAIEPSVGFSSSRSEADIDMGLATHHEDDIDTLMQEQDQKIPVSAVAASIPFGMKRKRVAETGRGDPPSTPPAKRAIQASERVLPFEKGDACEICLSSKDARKILLCDECDRGFHIYCLDPPLTSVPENDEWFCAECLLGTGNDFGFDEGEEHSIFSFQQRANSFRNDWFAKHPPRRNKPLDAAAPQIDKVASLVNSMEPNGVTERIGDLDVSEHEVEREFWRLVEAQDETVEVEYGADVHSTTHGSGAPTLETHPLEPKSKDGWNLNNIPILPKSLLRYIKSDISGMTVPWTYIGMLFAAFCWHNEDHYTYSVNYMYWGDTKTWYGIPGSDAERFEAAIKSEAPELFEQQPSLLFQLVTMMNPGRLKEAGVGVSVCNQRPGEFVITFPKAYHCGFNHGFNYNEAVNFALPDWLPYGYECIKRYQKHCKPPVFSHEELIVTIAHHSQSIKTAAWLRDSVEAMVKREQLLRIGTRSRYPQLSEVISDEDKLEDQYICKHCKTFCYLSQITCQCTKSVTCHEHLTYLCRCETTSRILRNRFSDQQLEEMLRQVSERALAPTFWRQRFHKLLEESPRPPLKALRAILADGEKVNYPIPELLALRPFVAQANAWVDLATSLFTKKLQARGRGRRGRDADGDETMEAQDEAAEDRSTRNVEDIENILRAGERLGFDAPELPRVRQLLSSCREFQEAATRILSTPDPKLADCETVYIQGTSLNVDLPELPRLQLLLGRLKWLADMNELDEHFLELHDVVRYLEQADEFEVPPTHEFYVNLQGKRRRGEDWHYRASVVVAACNPDSPYGPPITLGELDDLLEENAEVPVDGELQVRIKQIRMRALSAQQSCRSQLGLSGDAKRGTMEYAGRVLKSAEIKAFGVIIPEFKELRQELVAYERWLIDAAHALQTHAAVQGVLADMLEDVSRLLAPGDERPTDPTQTNVELAGKDLHSHALTIKFSCLCRKLPSGTMLKCRKCFELYHPKCLEITLDEVRNSKRRWKCLFCRSKDKSGSRVIKPSADALCMLVDPRRKFKFSFPELAFARDLLAMINRAAALILQDLNPISKVDQCTDRIFMRHWLKKLKSLPLDVMVHREGHPPLNLYDALFTRLRTVIKYDIQPEGHLATLREGPRPPKFIWAAQEGGKDVLNCVCVKPPADSIIQVRCTNCEQPYHASCVFAPTEALGVNAQPWQCPCCALDEGEQYKYAGVLCQFTNHVGTDIFIDRNETYRICSKAATVLSASPVRLDEILLEAKGFIPGVSEEEVKLSAWKAKQAALRAIELKENGSAAPTPTRSSTPPIRRQPPSIPPQPTMPRRPEQERRPPASRPSVPYMPEWDLHDQQDHAAQASIHERYHAAGSNALPGPSRMSRPAPNDRRHIPPLTSQQLPGPPTNTRGRPPNPNRPPIPIHPSRLPPIVLPPRASPTSAAHRAIDSPGQFQRSPTYPRQPPHSPGLPQPSYRPHAYSAVTKDMVIPPFRGSSATPSSRDGMQGSPKRISPAELTGVRLPSRPSGPSGDESRANRLNAGAYDRLGRQ